MGLLDVRSAMNRKRLPNRRVILTETFTFAGITHHGSIGFHPETGEVLEVFMEAGKIGSDVQQASRANGITASLALQYGCSIPELGKSLPKLGNNKPADALGTFLSLVADAT